MLQFARQIQVIKIIEVPLLSLDWFCVTWLRLSFSEITVSGVLFPLDH